jgi:hypothetical protein
MDGLLIFEVAGGNFDGARWRGSTAEVTLSLSNGLGVERHLVRRIGNSSVDPLPAVMRACASSREATRVRCPSRQRAQRAGEARRTQRVLPVLLRPLG